MNELALFAGAGGGLLASQWLKGWRTVCYVEREPYPVEVIKQRIADGYLDDAPIWDDVRTFDGRPWRGCVDIVTAGFPCQPFSVAGKRAAGDDDRNGWPDTVRIISEVRPRFALLENVPGLLAESHGYFGTVLSDLSACGYDARWRVLSAAEVGAPHKRDRLWILATDAASERIDGIVRNGIQSKSETWQGAKRQESYNGSAGHVAHAERQHPKGRDNRPEWWQRCEGQPGEEGGPGNGATNGWWQTEPNVGRVVDGVAARVDRLKAIGNGQVPLVAAVAWDLLTGGYK